MTPERIAELRDFTSGDDMTLSERAALLDIAERFARIAAILRPLEALEAAATPADWRVQGRGGIRMDGMRDSYTIVSGPYEVCRQPMGGKEVEHRDDFAMIAAARNALPALLREIQEVSDGRV